MKHWISFAVAGAAILAVLVYRQMRRFQVSVSPAPVLYFIAGSEQELTRLPVFRSSF